MHRRLFLFPLLIILILTTHDGEGCHKKRRKRAAGLRKTVKSFFPGCMRRMLSGIKDYRARDWKGAVSFAIFHSQWYELIDEACIEEKHTVECWADSISDFITGTSPAFHAAQQCVQAYFDFFFDQPYLGQTKQFRPGVPIVVNSGSCPAVNQTEFDNTFVSLVATEVDEMPNTEDESVTDLTDTVDFIKNDMICLTCSCENMDDDGEADYDFEDGKSCGSCWTTRLATGVRRGSRLRRPAGRIAKKKGGLRRKPRKPPKRGGDKAPASGPKQPSSGQQGVVNWFALPPSNNPPPNNALPAPDNPTSYNALPNNPPPNNAPPNNRPPNNAPPNNPPPDTGGWYSIPSPKPPRRGGKRGAGGRR